MSQFGDVPEPEEWADEPPLSGDQEERWGALGFSIDDADGRSELDYEPPERELPGEEP